MDSGDGPDTTATPLSFAAVAASDPQPDSSTSHEAPTAPLGDADPTPPSEETIQEWPTPAEAVDADTTQDAPAASPPEREAGTAENAQTAQAEVAAEASSQEPKVQPKGLGLGAGLQKPKARKAGTGGAGAAGTLGASSTAGPSSTAAKGTGKAGAQAGTSGAGVGLDLGDMGIQLGVEAPDDSSEWEEVDEDEASVAAIQQASKPGRPAPGPMRQAQQGQPRGWAAALDDLFDREVLIACGAVLAACSVGLLVLGGRAALARSSR